MSIVFTHYQHACSSPIYINQFYTVPTEFIRSAVFVASMLL